MDINLIPTEPVSVILTDRRGAEIRDPTEENITCAIKDLQANQRDTEHLSIKLRRIDNDWETQTLELFISGLLIYSIEHLGRRFATDGLGVSDNAKRFSFLRLGDFLSLKACDWTAKSQGTEGAWWIT